MTIRILWSLAALVVSALALAVALAVVLSRNGMPDELRSRLMGQICSGRWILTVLSGLCLVMLTLALIWKGSAHSVSGEALVAIISTVFVSYFRKERNGNGHGNGNGG